MDNEIPAPYIDHEPEYPFSSHAKSGNEVEYPDGEGPLAETYPDWTEEEWQQFYAAHEAEYPVEMEAKQAPSDSQHHPLQEVKAHAVPPGTQDYIPTQDVPVQAVHEPYLPYAPRAAPNKPLAPAHHSHQHQNAYAPSAGQQYGQAHPPGSRHAVPPMPQQHQYGPPPHPYEFQNA